MFPPRFFHNNLLNPTLHIISQIRKQLCNYRTDPSQLLLLAKICLICHKRSFINAYIITIVANKSNVNIFLTMWLKGHSCAQIHKFSYVTWHKWKIGLLGLFPGLFPKIRQQKKLRTIETTARSRTRSQRDSNSRAAYATNTLAGCPYRPLRHDSN